MKIGMLKTFGKNFINNLSEFRKAKRPERLALKRLEAKNFVAGISDETWNKMSKSIFAQPNEPKSKLLDKLKEIKSTYARAGITLPGNVAESFKTLEHKATVFADRMRTAIAKGKEPKNDWKYGEKFVMSNKKAISTIDNFITQNNDKLMSQRNITTSQSNIKTIKKVQIGSNKTLGMSSLKHITSPDLYSNKIQEVASEELKNGQILYHGTKHAKEILRAGFSLIPKTKQAAIASRELGQGIYLTPNKRTASWYAGLKGQILHLKLNQGKIAAVNNKQLSNMYITMATKLDSKFSEPAIQELVIKTLFQRNGYKAAYSREALGGLLGGKTKKIVDALAGGKQSQVCVFEPRDIKILGKTFKEKVENQIMQISSFVKAPFNILKGIMLTKNA